jgi:protocatechuate 3,4-dioxygenase beta subunit
VSRLLVALALVVGVGLATAPAQSAAAAQVSGTVTILGDTTTPMDYTVFFQPVGSDSSSGYAVTSSSFTLPTVSWPQAPGDYHVWFRFTMLDGLTRYYVAGQPAGSASRDDATVVTLGSTPPPAIVMTLPKLAHVTGTVTDGGGDALSGVTVEITKAAGYVGQHQATTDAHGRYDLGYVQAGSRTIHAYGTGDLAAAYDEVTVAASGNQTVDLVLDQEPATLEGTLTDKATGLPISFATVDLALWPAGLALASTQADADGHYSFTGLAAGGYRIWVADDLVEGSSGLVVDSGDTTVTAGATTVEDLTLEAVHSPGPHTVSGTVTDTQGDPLPGIRVSLLSASTGHEVAYAHTDRSGRWAWNVADGSYLIRARPSDRWTWVAPDSALWSPTYYPGTADADEATPVTVADGQAVTDVDLTLPEGTAVRIDVVDEHGTSLAFAGYDVYDADTGEHASDVGLGQYDPSPLVLRLPPGRWKVMVSGFADGGDWKVPQWYGGGNNFATAATITLAPGDNLTPTTLRLPEVLRPTTPPRIKGTPRRGQTLTATTGTWNLDTGTTYSFAWFRGRTGLGSGPTHVVRPADVGKTLKVTLRVHNTETNTTVTRSLTVRIAGRG